MEGLRLRCLDPRCTFRPGNSGPSGENAGDQTDSDQEKEGNQGDLCEVAEDSEDDVGGAGNQTSKDQSMQGKYLKELWPFARPVAQGARILQQMLHSETATRLVLLTRSAHPGLLVAARTVKLRSLGYYEVPPHNFAHGRALLEKMMIQLKVDEARRAVEADGQRKRTRDSDLQFRSVLSPPASEQLVEFKDIAPKHEADGSAWRAGLDRLVNDFNQKAANLLSKELEEAGLNLVVSERGKMLRAARPFRRPALFMLS